jgi:hypothetical protein
MRILLSSIDRRSVCLSIVGLAGDLVLSQSRSTPEQTPTEEEFVIINGWVLTRDDVTKATPF